MKKALKAALLPLICLTLNAVRFLFYGVKYFPQLDDYIQYHNFGQAQDKWRLITEQGLLGARPLAGICDVYVTSTLWGDLIIAVLLLSAMYTAAVFLLKKTFERHFQTGIFFIIIMLLCPLGFEGTYWLSASTRIIPGIFLSSLSAFFLQKYADSGKKAYVPLFLIASLMAFGFYEQTLVLSVTLNVIIAVLNRKKAVSAVTVIGTVSNLIIYLAIAAAFSDSLAYSGRTDIVLPSPSPMYLSYLKEVTSQLYNAFITGGINILFRGAYRGIKIILTDGIWYLPLTAALCTALGFIQNKTETGKPQGGAKPLVGLLLAVLPALPFYIVSNPWFSLRGTVASFCGIALLADTLFGFLEKRKTAAACCAIIAFLFCASSVSELHDYKLTYEEDTAIVKVINSITDDCDGKKIGILNLEPTYLPECNYFYHEHIHGVTESSWALTGACIAYEHRQFGTVVPLSCTGIAYKNWNYEERRLDGYDRLYLYEDGRLIPVFIEKTAPDSFNICRSDGSLCAVSYRQGENAYIALISPKVD